jgi:uncharacterized protein (TIGR02001 family)
MKTLSKAIALASLVSATALTAQVANAEVEYSAGIATTYLWRGTDLGNGSPAFSASADYSHDSGVFAGLWVSSGDDASGTEYDVYAGYAAEFGDLSADIGYYTYAYSSEPDDALGGPGELEEAILNLGYGDASLTYIDDLGNDDYSYIALGYSTVVDITVGMSDNGLGHEYTHIDLGYALTDELSLTVSKVIDQTTTAAFLAADSDNGPVDEDAIVVLSYSMAIQ